MNTRTRNSYSRNAYYQITKKNRSEKFQSFVNNRYCRFFVASVLFNKSVGILQILLVFSSVHT